jgi:ABC-type multidrug transport system fused ATPase/permease subunit
MVLMIPVGGAMGQTVAKKQKTLMQSTDKRIHSTHELLNGIRLVKFYAWETNFLSKIDAARDTELSNLWSYIRTIALNRALWYATPILVSFLTFATLTYICGEELTPAKAFTGLALFNTLKSPLQVFPDIIVRIQEALVSLRRINAFLDEIDLDDYRNLGIASQNDDLVGFPAPSKFIYQESSMAFTLENIQVTFPSKSLSVIVGPTGAGKTSLVMALLGELKCVMGGSNVKSRFTEIAYVPQQVWLMNATVRDNILFGLDYDQEKYQRVLQCCALEQDLLTLQSSDLTEVGEGGINLSGGQKARISLARATYSNAPCVILDDVLSAVDAPTARHLFEQCICGPFMKDRMRILVTHAVSLCAPKASEVVVMTKGRIQSRGFGKNILKTATAVLKEQALTSEDIENIPASSGNSHESPEDQEKPSISGGQLTQEESRSVGSVSGRIYLFYLHSAGGYWFIAALILTFLTSQLLVLGNDWWLKTWANAHLSLKTLALSIDTELYLIIYGIIGAITICILFFRILLIASGSIRASRRLHYNLLRKIMFASVRFFETTPSGRIMNRFSKDMKDIDMEVATFSADFLANLTSGCATLSLIIFVTPLTLFGIAPVGKLSEWWYCGCRS